MKRNAGIKTSGILLLAFLAYTASGGGGQVLTDGLTVYDTGSVCGAFSIAKGSVATSGASLYFHFNTNESGIVTDQSGIGNNGSVSGAVWTSSGYILGAYNFNGTNQYIAVPASSSLNLTTSITISAWVKFNGEGTGNQFFLAKHLSSWIQYGLMRFANSSGNPHKFGAALSWTSDNHQDFVSDYVLSDNSWYFLAMTFSKASSNVCLYVNGSLNKAITKSTAIYGDTVGNLELGREHKWSEYANAVVDDVRIFNRSLSGGEIMAIYNNTALGYSTSVVFSVTGGASDIGRLVRKGDIEMGIYTNGP